MRRVPAPRRLPAAFVVFRYHTSGFYRERGKLIAGIFSGEAAQSLVEFAVCLPVLLLVVTGVFTFGIALNDYLVLTESVSVGARTLAISRGQTTDPCSTASSVIYAAAPNLKSAKFSFTFVLNGTQYTGPSCNSSSLTTSAAQPVSSLNQIFQQIAGDLTVARLIPDNTPKRCGQSLRDCPHWSRSAGGSRGL